MPATLQEFKEDETIWYEFTKSELITALWSASVFGKIVINYAKEYCINPHIMTELIDEVDMQILEKIIADLKKDWTATIVWAQVLREANIKKLTKVINETILDGFVKYIISNTSEIILNDLKDPKTLIQKINPKINSIE